MTKRIYFKDYEVGDTVSELKADPIQHMDLVRYSGASGDFNPIHTDTEFAKKAGLEGTIVHGMYVMAQLGRLLTNWAEPSQIQLFGVKFKGMVRPGEKLLYTAKVKRKKEENGKKLLTITLQALFDKEVRAEGDAVISCCE